MLYIFTIIGAMFAITEVVANTSDIVSQIIPNGDSTGSLWLWTGLFVAMMLIVSIILWIVKGVIKKRSKKNVSEKYRRNNWGISD